MCVFNFVKPKIMNITPSCLQLCLLMQLIGDNYEIIASNERKSLLKFVYANLVIATDLVLNINKTLVRMF